MIYTVICFVAFSVIQIIVNISSLRKLGNFIYCTNSVMSKKELLSIIIKGSSSILLAVLFEYSAIINETIYKCVIAGLIGVYTAYAIYPLINYYLFKNKIGVYENGVMTYDGVMKYSLMKEYMIKENEQNITVYCKSNVTLLTSVKHFDVNEELAEKINYYFKKKHSNISKNVETSRKA